MRDAPVSKAVAGGVEQTQGEAHEPKRRIGQRKADVLPDRSWRFCLLLWVSQTFMAGISLPASTRFFFQHKEHVYRAQPEQPGRHIKRPAPTKFFRGPAGEDARQRLAE